MKGVENSSGKMDKLEKIIFEQLSSDKPKDSFFIPEKEFNPEDSAQNFYKAFKQHASEHIILKHGHKIFRLCRHEQDLAFFCFSLLQFEAKFPVRIFCIDGKKANESLAQEESV